MRQAGDVTYADAHKTRKNEGVVEFACKGVSINVSMIITRADCFVIYHSHAPNITSIVLTQDLKNAMDKLDGSELNGRRIKLIEESRGRSRSRSRSNKSRSRSRNRSRSKSRSRYVL